MSNNQNIVNALQQTTTDIIVEYIRNEIIRGDFPPGTRLRLRQLAEQFNVSTMPIREALQLLESEGLVINETRKGVKVTELTPAELEDIYDIRANLEEMATRLAVPHITQETLDTLKELVHQIETSQGDVVKIVETNTRFHALIYAASGRKHLCSLITVLRNRTAHYFHNYMAQLESVAETDHLAIIEACQQGDAERAAKIMHGHVTRAGQAVIKKYKEM